jgi:hypothetical protein
MRLYVGLVVLSVCLFPASASTVLNGWINKDSTLNVAGSPYLVNDYVGITYGHTLIIEPGVVLRFGSGADLNVYGNLLADGATFQSSASTPTPGAWGHLTIGSSDTAYVHLKDCNVEYATGISVTQKGKLLLENTALYRFASTFIQANDACRGILLKGGSLTSVSTSVSDNPIGIHMDGNASLTVEGTSFRYLSRAIWLGYRSSLQLTDASIRDNGYPVVFANKANLEVAGNNDIQQNTYNGFYVTFGTLNDDWTLPSVEVPYLFPSSFTVSIGVRLTVGAGNILKFNPNTALEVEGALTAQGQEGQPILFTSMRDDNAGGDSNNDGTASAPASRNWYGIRFWNSSVDSLCLLRRCTIRYAGCSDIGGITTYTASPTIDQCTLSNNYFGICLQGVSCPVITQTTIGSSDLTPLALSFEADPVMSGNVLSFSDNAYDAIGILGGELSANARLKVRSFSGVDNLTYLLLGEIHVPAGKTLTIDKGITIKAYQWDWPSRRIIVDGSLIANATADSMITFTSARDDNVGTPGDCNKDGTITSPSIGDWQGFIFQPGSSGVLNYCRIKYARMNDYPFASCNATEYVHYAAIGLIDASPTITHCEFKDLSHAVSCYRASSPVIQDCDMINILYTPINLAGPANPTLSGISFTNVRCRALGLLGGSVCLNGTIQKRNVAGFTNITYVLLADMVIQSGTTVNIDPGVVIKAYKDHWNEYYFGGSSIYVDGCLKVNGTSTDRVVFTSLKDDNEGNPYDTNNDGNASTPSGGDWGTIQYRSNSDDAGNCVQYASIKYAGYTQQGGLSFENAGGKVQNVWVSNASYYGLYFNGNSNPVVSNASIRNCGKDPLAMSLTANPSFSGIDFVSNFSQAIKIIEGTLSSQAILSSRSLAGITNIGYVVDKLTIASGAKLTIEPGVVVKFRSDDWYRTYLNVYGNLIAKGTPTNKIYFTSFKDDSRGGDSNNNGNTDAPQPGDWGYEYYGTDPYGGICFFDNTTVSDTVNVLKNCEISYAQIGVRVDNAHATVDSCVIQLCQHYGLSSIGSANPRVSHTQFYNIGYTPVELSLFSNPQFQDIEALNVGYMGLAVIPETYSKSATVPIRDFAGYPNITYVLENACTVNSGCTLTIPAGVSFKAMYGMPSGSTSTWGSGEHAYGFVVNGRLCIQGTADKPVVFAHAADDAYGSPADLNRNGKATAPPEYWNWTGTWIVFNDVSDDSSRMDHAVFRYGDKGIVTNSASPTCNALTFEKLHYGIDMNGVSAPRIDSCLFNDLYYYPIQVSLVSYPASTQANRIGGTTYKVIKVRDEILTQDAVLPKRNFGGKTNIPYLFTRYEIGTSAALTIDPGVICKFEDRYYWYDNSFHVKKGLKALGGASRDSLIVFTSIKDDFYGGDSNSDSTATTPQSSAWRGLLFTDLSLDPVCALSHCVFRYADRALTTASASPEIRSCQFNTNDYGIALTGASDPLIEDCDFNEIRYYAVDNVDRSFDVQALNCWWGSNDGPRVSTADDPGNDAEQEAVTPMVSYAPYRTSGILNPLTGDVSLNGRIQAYDASLVLKEVVGSVVLADNQLRAADVSGNGAVSAYDASLILQYVVGLQTTFPIHLLPRSRAAADVSAPALSMNDVSASASAVFTTSVSASGTFRAAAFTLAYDPSVLQLETVEKVLSGAALEYRLDPGLVTVALAGGSPWNDPGEVVRFGFRSVAPAPSETRLTLPSARFNEGAEGSDVASAWVHLDQTATGLADAPEKGPGLSVYAEAKGGYALAYTLTSAVASLRAEVYGADGRLLRGFTALPAESGTHRVRFSDMGLYLPAGTYLLRLQTSDSLRSCSFTVR